MKLTSKLLPPLALAGALALVPVTTSSLAAADVANYQELETFMSVYERVKSQYVDQVDDHTLIKGAIDGMLASLDPHSSFVEATDFDVLEGNDRRQLRRTGDHGRSRGRRGEGRLPDGRHAGMARRDQVGRLHHAHQRRAALRPHPRRSRREDERPARNQRQAEHRPPRARQAVRRLGGP